MENLQRLEQVKWTSITLKTPVVFRQNNSQFIIRYMRNVKGAIMCELVMDDDRAMKNINDLPADVQKSIDQHLKLQA